MERSRMMVLVLAAVAVLLAAQAAAREGIGGGGGGAALRAEVLPLGPCRVRVSLANGAASARVILLRGTPFETPLTARVLRATAASQTQWLAPVVLRTPPSAADPRVSLDPGQAITRELDVCQLMRPPRSSVDVRAVFTVTEETSIGVLSQHVVRSEAATVLFPRLPLAPPQAWRPETAMSAVQPDEEAEAEALDALQAELEDDMEAELEAELDEVQLLELGFPGEAARGGRARGLRAGEDRILVSGCSRGRRVEIARAVRKARRSVVFGLAVLDGSLPWNATLARYFGDSSAEQLAEDVAPGMQRLLAALREEVRLDCDGGSCRSNWLAYVWSGDASRTVHLCDAFFDAPSEPWTRDGQAGILVHELSHFATIGDTEDHAYGEDALVALARDAPELARANADSWEAITEALPWLYDSPF